jgi:hypothetical protein
MPKQFEDIRGKLNAKVIHLVRHPVRWGASVIRWMKVHFSGMTTEMYGRNNADFNQRYRGQDWYRLARHEDLVADPDRVRDLLQWCGLEPGEAFDSYVEMMNRHDMDNDTSHRMTVMKSETLLNRWRDLRPEVAARLTKSLRHWDWAGYETLDLEVTP